MPIRCLTVIPVESLTFQPSENRATLNAPGFRIGVEKVPAMTEALDFALFVMGNKGITHRLKVTLTCQAEPNVGRLVQEWHFNVLTEGDDVPSLRGLRTHGVQVYQLGLHTIEVMHGEELLVRVPLKFVAAPERLG